VTSAFSIEQDAGMTPGDTRSIAGYDFRFLGSRDVEGPNFSAVEGEVLVSKEGEEITLLQPQKRVYRVQQSPMTEAAIHARLSRDLFVAMGEPLGGEAWSLRIQYKPFIRLIWLGCLIMSFGGLVSLSDRRYRARQKAESPASAAAEAST
ncbi:MAG: cytochrome c-type biogenesis CcmF C-terminal domain-containing protein, partial [Gammaproteobacteria bacterium]